MIGAEYSASWGRYRVHREDLDQVVLADVRSPSAFVTVTREKLARDYTLEQASAASSPPAAPPPERWTPPPARVRDWPETLGAPIPRSNYHVPAVSHETGLYWMPCMRRFEGEAHAWFVSEGAQVLCPACRGVDRVVERIVDPPPLEPELAAHLREVGAGVRAILKLWADPIGVRVRPVVESAQSGARNPEVAGSNPAGSAARSVYDVEDLEQLDQVVVDRDVKPENVRRCEDCGKRMGVGHYGGERGEVFCGACLELSPHLQEVLARYRTGAAPPPVPSRRKQRDEDSHQGNARSEIGSVRVKDEKLPPTPTADLWAGYTKDVPR